MTLVTVFNTTDQPVLVDADGREVGGREWGTADTTAAATKAAFDNGSLIRADIPAEGEVNPLAAEAAARTDRLTARRDFLQGADQATLDRLALAAGLPSDLNKTELVQSLAFREDVAVPAAKEK